MKKQDLDSWSTDDQGHAQYRTSKSKRDREKLPFLCSYCGLHENKGTILFIVQRDDGCACMHHTPYSCLFIRYRQTQFLYASVQITLRRFRRSLRSQKLLHNKNSRASSMSMPQFQIFLNFINCTCFVVSLFSIVVVEFHTGICCTLEIHALCLRLPFNFNVFWKLQKLWISCMNFHIFSAKGKSYFVIRLAPILRRFVPALSFLPDFSNPLHPGCPIHRRSYASKRKFPIIQLSSIKTP